MSIHLLELLLNPKAASQATNKFKVISTKVVKARDPSVNGSFDEPVRKGRKPEVSKNHPAVIECRRLCMEGHQLHRVAILAGVDYTILARWYDKGWMDPPKVKRKDRKLDK